MDAMVAGGRTIEDNLEVISDILRGSRDVYREFQRNCEEVGVWRSPISLRKEMGSKLDRMLDLRFLAKVL